MAPLQFVFVQPQCSLTSKTSHIVPVSLVNDEIILHQSLYIEVLIFLNLLYYSPVLRCLYFSAGASGGGTYGVSHFFFCGEFCG